MRNYGKKSKQRLSEGHVDIQKIFNLFITRTSVDVSIIEVHRPVTVQQEYYKIGRTIELNRKPITKIDGINKLGKHNLLPSEAVDFMIWHNDKEIRNKIAWDKSHLSYVAGMLQSCAFELYDKKEITHLLRWGANWDKDGVLFFDQDFDDAPHVELYKP
jgi:peptidoglycan L-alanyl-D-glutamate endopeptidase CwlK